MNHSRRTLLCAAWVAPMAGPPVPDAGVVFQGDRIAATGPISELRRKYPDADIHDAGNAVILPGLVNAHTHLELSNLRPGERPARFVDWIINLISQSSLAGQAVQQSIQLGMQAGIAQCLKFGVTCVGDITSQPRPSREILSRSRIGGVSFGEVRAMASRRGFLEERIAVAAQPIEGSARLHAGITPHAPYSIESTGYRRCLETARAGNLPLATHLAETPEEALFLAAHEGPFRELWTLLSAWDDHVPKLDGGPIRMAKSIGLLDYQTLLAHVNYADDNELAVLAGGVASVVYCPRTHDYFGHPPHRWRDMLARGVNVAVGTDSCASSPDLNLVDDLRLLHRLTPEVAPRTLWEMATIRAAKAIGCVDVGSLLAGNRADAVVFSINGSDPLSEILQNHSLPKSTWIDGALIFSAA